MAGCSSDASQFFGVLPLLGHIKAKFTPAGVTSADFVPHTASLAEVSVVEEVEVIREELSPSLALSQAQVHLQKVEARRNGLEEELAGVNAQLAQAMSVNEGLQAEIRRAKRRSEEVSPGQLQHIQAQELRADVLIKKIDNFCSHELKLLEQEVHDLSTAQRRTSADLTSSIKECHALLECLRKKERQVYSELWRMEDEVTLLDRKSECWRQAETASAKAGEEERQQHHQALALLEVVTQDFTQVNRRAEEVCRSLASQRLLPPPSPLGPQSSLPS